MDINCTENFRQKAVCIHLTMPNVQYILFTKVLNVLVCMCHNVPVYSILGKENAIFINNIFISGLKIAYFGFCFPHPITQNGTKCLSSVDLIEN